MTTFHPRSRTWTAAAVGLVFGVFVAGGRGQPVWAGQEEQFTPEYKELRTSFDPKHTPKITAPDSVTRGQWFDGTIDIGAGGEHPSLREHAIRYLALDIHIAALARAFRHPDRSFTTLRFSI